MPNENQTDKTKLAGKRYKETEKYALIEHDEKMWDDFSEEDRSKYIDHIEKFYRNLVDDFLEIGNEYAVKYKKSRRSYKRWRVALIVLSGVLAILNVLIAFLSSDKTGSEIGKSLCKFLPLGAAVFACVLAILQNLESFLNYREIKRTYRESRELFIDNYQEFESLWKTYVYARGSCSDACENATRLYKKIISKDKEIRSYLRELSEGKEKEDTKNNIGKINN